MRPDNGLNTAAGVARPSAATGYVTKGEFMTNREAHEEAAGMVLDPFSNFGRWK